MSKGWATLGVDDVTDRRVTTPEGNRSGMGVTGLSSGVTWWQGFVIEAVITYILVQAVLALAEEGFAGKLAVGFSITACHLAFVSSTTASRAQISTTPDPA
ncbi:hypothetical protein FOCC_FOCC001917 [Frankliniella occidentalis]|nr:hypothetical protein FOCC_FOCC001917 [Frankliniella occidentalis]